MTDEATAPKEGAVPEPLGELDMFIRFALDGANELRALLPLDEGMFVRVSAVGHSNGRAYVLYNALDEVEKAAMQLIRLQETIGGEPVNPREDRPSRLVVTHLVEEERARTRRLLELFVMLVLFGEINEDPYYRHLLAVEELLDHLHQNRDLEEFHGARSANVDNSIEWMLERVVECQKEVDLTLVWYLENHSAIPTSPSPKHGALLNKYLKSPSIRELVKRALPLMLPHEKLHFGTSYAEAYRDPSESVHFGAVARAYRVDEDDEYGGAVRLGLLTVGVLARIHDLMGRPPAKAVEKIVRGLERSDAPRLLFMLTEREIQVGDFVVAYNSLAEVLETRVSVYGNRSYRARFLAERPIPEIEEDWFPARYVQRLYNHAEFLSSLDVGTSGTIPEDLRKEMRNAPPEEMQNFLRQAIQWVWPRGMRDAVLGAPKKKRERPRRRVATESETSEGDDDLRTQTPEIDHPLGSDRDGQGVAQVGAEPELGADVGLRLDHDPASAVHAPGDSGQLPDEVIAPRNG